MIYIYRIVMITHNSLWIPINSASDAGVGTHGVYKMETPMILWDEYPQCNGLLHYTDTEFAVWNDVKWKWKWLSITSNAAELYITKLTAALHVICLGCHGTIRGHQSKRGKFKGQGQMCWRSCKVKKHGWCTLWKFCCS